MLRNELFPTAAPVQLGAIWAIRPDAAVLVTRMLNVRRDPSSRSKEKFCPAVLRAVVSL